MRPAPSTSHLVIVDGLLTMLARRTYGALDLGLVLLLESPADQYAQFVAARVIAPMRALATVLVLAVAEAQAEVATSPFDALVLDTERFAGALEDLGRWRSAAPGAVRDAVGRLAAATRRIIDTLLDIGERLCFEPAMVREFPRERHESAMRRIAELPAELGAGAAPALPPSGPDDGSAASNAAG